MRRPGATDGPHRHARVCAALTSAAPTSAERSEVRGSISWRQPGLQRRFPEDRERRAVARDDEKILQNDCGLSKTASAMVAFVGPSASHTQELIHTSSRAENRKLRGCESQS